MKLCLICGHREDDSRATCSKCGEGSWAMLAEESDIVKEQPPQSAQATEPVRKRGGKR